MSDLNNIGNDGMDINSKNYYKVEKEKLESYNKQLLLHIKNVEDENKNLRDALKDLRELEREKDLKLEESIKLIMSQKSKNDNYAKEIENYDKKINLCQQEIKELRKNTKEDIKQKEFLENVDKVNSSLKSERDKMKKELTELKAKFEEIKSSNQDLVEESKMLKKEIDELKEKNNKLENEKMDLNDKDIKAKNIVNKLNSDLIKKDEEVKTLIKMAQELNNESKINIDEVTKQSKDIVNMFYNNFTNKNSQNNTMSFDKLLDVYKDCQILSKPEIQKSIKENKISFVLEQAILKDFVVPEIFVNERTQSTCVVNIPLEIFYNMTLKTDLLKVEMMAGYLREMNIVEFIEDKFNKKIVNILDKNITSSNRINQNSFKENKKGFLSDQAMMNNTAYLGQNKNSFNLTNNPGNTQFNNNTAQGFKLKTLNDNLGMTSQNHNINYTQNQSYYNQNQFMGYLDFFQNLAIAFSDSQEKIEVLENNIMLLNHENSLLKATNREYQEKNVFYEESIMSLKDLLKSTQNIFETKLNNTLKLVQQMSISSKEKEFKIKESMEKHYNEKIAILNKEIRDLNDQIILKTTLVSITQKESEKYKILAEKNSISNKGNDKNKKVNKNNSDFYIHLEQQEKDANILEVELDKLKSEMKINIEKLNLCNVKLQDSESEIERLTKYSNLLKNELDKTLAEKSNIILELENARLNLNIAEEKLILTSQPKIFNKDRLNQTGISSNVLDNKSNNNNSNLNTNNHNVKEIDTDTKRNIRDLKEEDKFIKFNENKEIKEENSEKFSNQSSIKQPEVKEKDQFKSSKSVIKKNEFTNNTFNVGNKKPTANYFSKEDSSFNSSSPKTNQIYFNNSNILNESFNKDSYIKKKQENTELKNQIERLKEQLREIIHEKNQLEENVGNRNSFFNLVANKENLIEITPYYSNVNNNFTKPINPFVSKKLDTKSNLILGSLLEKTSKLKQNCKFSTFNELKKYYLEYNMDLDKISQKIEEVALKFTKIEKTIMEEDENKKIKIGYVKEAFNQTDKLLYLLNSYIGKYNKDFYFYSSNLQKVLDFLYNNIYYENSELSLLLNQGYSELGQNLLNEAIGNRPKQELISNVTSYESKKIKLF